MRRPDGTLYATVLATLAESLRIVLTINPYTRLLIQGIEGVRTPGFLLWMIRPALLISG